MADEKWQLGVYFELVAIEACNAIATPVEEDVAHHLREMKGWYDDAFGYISKGHPA